MKNLHLICRREPEGIGRLNLRLLDKESKIYISGKWLFSIEEAKTLVGGMIFLHETKSDLSAFGGLVTEVQETTFDDKSQKNRVEFIFEARKEGRGVAWGGASHSMAWTSGFLDID
jgi:hypothetical protein|tara:strand:- start:363 stop:710 length:348 start_codon:yes stop_codon:yes gene_type:complete